jgi:hypothetical protein
MVVTACTRLRTTTGRRYIVMVGFWICKGGGGTVGGCVLVFTEEREERNKLLYRKLLTFVLLIYSTGKLEVWLINVHTGKYFRRGHAGDN